MEGLTGKSFWLYAHPKLDAWLKEACAVYLPGYPAMCPTAMRQFWETVLLHDVGGMSANIVQAQAAMHNAMDHGAGVAQSHYQKGKATKVARDAKACTISYFGELVPWPADKLTKEFLQQNAASVLAKFLRASDATQGAIEEVDDDGVEACSSTEAEPPTKKPRAQTVINQAK